MDVDRLDVLFAEDRVIDGFHAALRREGLDPDTMSPLKYAEHRRMFLRGAQFAAQLFYELMRTE